MFGDDYNTPDGSAIRDYIDVVDLAKLMWCYPSFAGRENKIITNILTSVPEMEFLY